MGLPGSLLDDGTSGEPFFGRGRAGVNWDVVLTVADNPSDFLGAHTWGFSLKVEGSLRITDITTNGTSGCKQGSGFPECKALPVGFEITELTGPPDGRGPQTPENTGAVSFVVLKLDGALMLPPETVETVCKVRVTGIFPEREGEKLWGKIVFTTLSTGRNVPPQVYVGSEIPITQEIGDPVLMLEDCVVTLKSSSVAAFVRCDSNNDGVATISDPIWMLNDLFLAGPATACRAAADCDGDGVQSVSDAVFMLTHLFAGGSPPPMPFPLCGRVDIPVEECPPGSTVCP